MNKEKFLEIAGQIYDNLNTEVDNKIVANKSMLDEITDRISSDLFELGEELLDDYYLKIVGNNEVEIDTLSLDFRKMDRVIKGVLNEYFITN
jgi:hypothetical protein